MSNVWTYWVSTSWDSGHGFLCRVSPNAIKMTVDGEEIVGSHGYYAVRNRKEHFASEAEAYQAVIDALSLRKAKINEAISDLRTRILSLREEASDE